MPGSMPATSQLEWLSSTTAMIVLFWSRATRDLLRSFDWGIAALHRLDAATKLPCLAARPIASIGPAVNRTASGEGARNHRRLATGPNLKYGTQLVDPGSPFGNTRQTLSHEPDPVGGIDRLRDHRRKRCPRCVEPAISAVNKRPSASRSARRRWSSGLGRDDRVRLVDRTVDQFRERASLNAMPAQGQEIAGFRRVSFEPGECGLRDLQLRRNSVLDGDEGGLVEARRDLARGDPVEQGSRR